MFFVLGISNKAEFSRLSGCFLSSHTVAALRPISPYQQNNDEVIRRRPLADVITPLTPPHGSRSHPPRSTLSSQGWLAA